MVVVPHYIPGHWCCATADLDNERIVYYDPFYNGPHRTGALGALGAFADQVFAEQGGGGSDRRDLLREIGRNFA